MKRFGFVIAVAFTCLVGIGISIALPAPTRTQPASAFEGAGASFDHSNCQYPDRWSNPADGCDNSDPAVPECIKAATTQESEQTCIAEYVRQYEVQGGVQVNNPPQASAPPANQCGGK